MARKFCVELKKWADGSVDASPTDRFWSRGGHDVVGRGTSHSRGAAATALVNTGVDLAVTIICE